MSTSLLTQEILLMGNDSVIISQGFPQYPSLTVENQWRKLIIAMILIYIAKNIGRSVQKYNRL